MTSKSLTPALRNAVFSTLLALLPLSAARATTFELDIKELDKAQPARKEQKKHTSARKSSQAGAHTGESAGNSRAVEGGQRYTVKPGDHIFKILMKELGLSNDEAERLVPDVASLNNLKDVRKLAVGQVLILPSTKERPRKQQTARKEEGGETAIRKRKTADKKLAPAAPPVAASEPAQEEAPVEANTSVPAPQPAPEPPLAPRVAASMAPVKVWSIPSGTTEEMIDALLKALEIKGDKQRIVETNYGGGSVLSIKVDRYFEESGKRYIVNCSTKDQFNYTLLRLLEREGYKVIQAERLDFRKTAENLLGQLGLPFEYTVRKEGDAARELPGYLVGDGKVDRQLFLTDSSVR